MRKHCVACAVEPPVAVGGHAGLLDVGDQPSALVVGHPVAGRGLDERQIVNTDHPQRAAHREMLDQGAPLVELGVEICHGEAGQPGPHGQVGGGRVGRMQPDEVCDGVADRARRFTQEVPPGQPASPFGSSE